MNNREMLKEAIADAKAVKEMAIANAKAALEEAFNPQLKSMLADKLMEMEDMDEGAEEEVEEGYGKGEVEERLGTINDPDSREPHGNLEEEEMIDEEMDLDEILAEIEKELDESSTKDITENEDEISEAEETETEDEDEEIDLDDMSEDDLKSFIEDVIADMVKAGELEAGEELESDDEEDVDVEIEDEEETEDAEEAEDAEAEIEEGYKNKEKEDMGDMEMKEMAGQISSLKKELNEINLLNSKLLYVNKIFRSKNLTESQKTKVLGAFDKAQSVKEVKLVFETISENLSTTKKSVVRENLGRASKPAGMSTRKPIMEVDSQVSRWQKLAGIK